MSQAHRNNTRRGRVTLCWDCQRAAGPKRCCWAGAFEPVPGWTAQSTPWRGSPGSGTTPGSYLVLQCPLFIEDERRDEHDGEQRATAQENPAAAVALG